MSHCAQVARLGQVHAALFEALARAVDRPTILTPSSVWDEMKLVLDTMTSNTGPLSSPSKI